jgi:uncharacterized membrane protein YkoI
MKPRMMPLLLAVLVLLAASIAHAEEDDDDQELARRALEQGQALPLAEILAKLKPEVPGKVIKIELEADDGALVYELKVLRPDGRIEEIEVDAKTGKLLEIEDDD